MGFRPKRTVLKLVFEDPDFEGFEVRMYRATMADVFEFGKYPDYRAAVATKELTVAEAEAHLVGLYDRLAEVIIDWNLEDDEGNPMPVSVASLQAQEGGFFWAMVRAWQQSGIPQGSELDGPLERPSSDGEPFPEANIPMEALSESLAS